MASRDRQDFTTSDEAGVRELAALLERVNAQTQNVTMHQQEVLEASQHTLGNFEKDVANVKTRRKEEERRLKDVQEQAQQAQKDMQREHKAAKAKHDAELKKVDKDHAKAIKQREQDFEADCSERLAELTELVKMDVETQGTFRSFSTTCSFACMSAASAPSVPISPTKFWCSFVFETWVALVVIAFLMASSLSTCSLTCASTPRAKSASCSVSARWRGTVECASSHGGDERRADDEK